MPAASTPRVQHDTRRAVGVCPLYKVLLHNDDVTPYPFVLAEVCVGILRLSRAEAVRVTEEAHHRGIAIASVLPLEQAEFKCEQARSLARGRGYPLRVTFEPA